MKKFLKGQLAFPLEVGGSPRICLHSVICTKEHLDAHSCIGDIVAKQLLCRCNNIGRIKIQTVGPSDWVVNEYWRIATRTLLMEVKKTSAPRNLEGFIKSSSL